MTDQVLCPNPQCNKNITLLDAAWAQIEILQTFLATAKSDVAKLKLQVGHLQYNRVKKDKKKHEETARLNVVREKMRADRLAKRRLAGLKEGIPGMLAGSEAYRKVVKKNPKLGIPPPVIPSDSQMTSLEKARAALAAKRTAQKAP